MHVDKINFNGSVNIGLNAYCNDKYCLVGKDIPEADVKRLEEVLKVPVHQMSIARSSLLGAFLAGNNEKLLVPRIAYKNELKILDELKIAYEVIDTDHTALGNNVLCNDEGAIINPDIEEDARKQIERALKVPVVLGKIAKLEIVGALCAHNDKGGLIHRDATDKEIDMVEKMLKITVEIGTLNFGSPYIHSASIVNKNGFFVGESTTGPEIQNADYAFGFLDR